MRIDVSGLRQDVGDHLRQRFSEEVPPLSLGDDEANFVAPAQVTADLYNTGKGIAADVRVKAEVQLNCSRCLKPFGLPLEVHFQEEYRPEDGTPAGGPGRPEQDGKGRRRGDRAPEPETEEEDDQEYLTYSGDEIDLTQSVQESLFLALPMKPLCKTDCLGLCPQCGHDLNEGPCGHEEPVSDPRLFALRELWEKNSKH